MNKIYVTIVLLFLMILSFVGMSQDNIYERNYVNGKELYKLGKYGLAMQALETVTQAAANNPYAEYASYFYALAAYHSGKLYQAKSMLLQIQEKFPDWDKMDEVRLWLSRIYFENEQIDLALQQVNSIRSNEAMATADQLEFKYLENVMDEDSLQLLLEKYPNDTSIAQVLASQIIEQPLINRNIELLKDIVQKYKLEEDIYDVVTPEQSEKKDRYKVAVLFPFMYNQYASLNDIGQNFVFDLYQGMQLARNQLATQGINIDLFAYDTQRSAPATSKILEREELKGMDLIIGPLLSATVEKVSEYSYENKINMINPVSANSKVIGNNPYSFLFLSSLETQGREAAKFANQHYKKGRVLVYYGESTRDSVLAHNYKLGLDVNKFSSVRLKKVSKDDTKSIFQFLTSMDAETEVEDGNGEHLAVPGDSISHVLVASDSDDGMIAANLISAVETRGDSIKILGLDDWLEYSFVIPEQLERLDVHMIAPSYIDITSEDYQQFRSDYLRKNYMLPSKFSGIGFEMLWFFGQQLYNNGVYFQVNFENIGFKKGYLMPGFNFENANDNQFVPIIKFVDAELRNINQVARKYE